MNQETALRQYKSHTGNKGDLHFKRIGNNVVDVFQGEGFGQPSRYRLIKGSWAFVNGPDRTINVSALVNG